MILLLPMFGIFFFFFTSWEGLPTHTLRYHTTWTPVWPVWLLVQLMLLLLSKLVFWDTSQFLAVVPVNLSPVSVNANLAPSHTCFSTFPTHDPLSTSFLSPSWYLHSRAALLTVT